MTANAVFLLIFTFLLLTFLGVPLAISIVASAFVSVALILPWDTGLFTMAQKMIAGLDSFSLLAVPFFILSGVIMNSGGIAIRLVNFAKLIAGRIPGSLSQTNIAGNMLFGSISGSPIAASTAIGGVMVPTQAKEGYDRGFAGAINIASAPTGMLIPPTTAFIIYSLVSEGTSIAALFIAGAVAGTLWGVGLMVLAGIIAKKRNYPTSARVDSKTAIKITLEALPSLFLIILIIGGILFGIVTPVEASGIAVIYTLLLTFVIHRTAPLKDLSKFLIETTKMTGAIMLLLAASTTLSFAMALIGLPDLISNFILGISENPFIVMIIINIILLFIGCFMDIGPAIMIFTPILLPIVEKVGYDPIHFGVIMVFNLAIGTITPPVGTGLFIGSAIADIKVERAIKNLLPFYGLLFAILLIITYIPAITLSLPRLFGI